MAEINAYWGKCYSFQLWKLSNITISDNINRALNTISSNSSNDWSRYLQNTNARRHAAVVEVPPYPNLNVFFLDWRGRRWWELTHWKSIMKPANLPWWWWKGRTGRKKKEFFWKKRKHYWERNENGGCGNSITGPSFLMNKSDGKGQDLRKRRLTMEEEEEE